jgi:hypothetical protein
MPAILPPSTAAPQLGAPQQGHVIAARVCRIAASAVGLLRASFKKAARPALAIRHGTFPLFSNLMFQRAPHPIPSSRARRQLPLAAQTVRTGPANFAPILPHDLRPEQSQPGSLFGEFRVCRRRVFGIAVAYSRVSGCDLATRLALATSPNVRQRTIQGRLMHVQPAVSRKHRTPARCRAGARPACTQVCEPGAGAPSVKSSAMTQQPFGATPKAMPMRV